MISAFWAPEGAAGAVKAAMSHDLIVPSVTTSVATAESAGLAKASTGVAVEEPKAVAPSLVGPNPSLELDPMLGLVVIQFRNDAGADGHGIFPLALYQPSVTITHVPIGEVQLT
jgi:hypothetical protein